MLEEPSRIKRINEYFALPAALRSDSALTSIVSFGKGVFKTIGSKFLEVMNPKIELTVQTREIEKVNTGKNILDRKLSRKIENRGEDSGIDEIVLPLKRPLDCAQEEKVRKVVCRTNSSAQTDLPYEPKPKGSINRLELKRKPEQSYKPTESTAELDTKGSEEDDDETGYKKASIRKKGKVWIHRGPSLEVIPEIKETKKHSANPSTSAFPLNREPQSPILSLFPPKPVISIPDSKTTSEGQLKNGGIDFSSKSQSLFSIPTKNNESNLNSTISSFPNSSLFNFSSNNPSANPTTLLSSDKNLNQSLNLNQNSSQSLNGLKYFQISPENQLKNGSGLETPKFEREINDGKSQNLSIFSQKPKAERPAFVPASPPPAYLNKEFHRKSEDLATKIVNFDDGLKGLENKGEDKDKFNEGKIDGGINPFVYDSGSSERFKGNEGKEKVVVSQKVDSGIGSDGKSEERKGGLMNSSNEEVKGFSIGMQTLSPAPSTIPQAVPLSAPSSSSSISPAPASVTPPVTAPVTAPAPSPFTQPTPAATTANQPNPPAACKSIPEPSQPPPTQNPMPPRTVISNYQSNPFLNTSAFKPSCEVSYRFGESRIDPIVTPAPMHSSLPISSIQSIPRQFGDCDIDMGVGPNVNSSNFGGSSSTSHNLNSSFQGFEGNLITNGFNSSGLNLSNCMNNGNNGNIGNHSNGLNPGLGSSDFSHMQNSYSANSVSFGQSGSVPAFQASFNPLSFGQSNLPTSQGSSFINGSAGSANANPGNKGTGFSLGIISGNANKRGRK